MSNVYIITAPSGAGKTTIAQAIAKAGDWTECISHTTRKIRDGEQHGKTYYYVDVPTFNTMKANDELAENLKYNGNLYGISKAEIERVTNTGRDVFIIAEYHGYLQIKDIYPNAIGIFIHMSKEDCLANMLLRGDKINDALERVSFYDDEMKDVVDYDYVIRNVRDKRFETENIIKSIIRQNSNKITISASKSPIVASGQITLTDTIPTRLNY